MEQSICFLCALSSRQKKKLFNCTPVKYFIPPPPLMLNCFTEHFRFSIAQLFKVYDSAHSFNINV
jgi:hypothetical protein